MLIMFIFCISLFIIVSATLTIIASTIEYFINDTLTKAIAKEYKTNIKVSITLLFIGLILMNIYIHFEGIPNIL